MRAALLATMVLACACLPLGGCGSAGEPEVVSARTLRAALAGSPRPLARLHSQSGQVLDSSPEGFDARLRALRGFPVVIVGWGSWCPPCRAELPFIQAAALRHGRRVAFLGLDVLDSTVRARELLRGLALPFPHYADANARILRALGGGAGVPTSVFIDRDGHVAFVHQGPFRSVDDITATIRRELQPGART
jgi:cytochrome c biogenesis protein CcmG, thiol:disulfide interchange protein DsbE